MRIYVDVAPAVPLPSTGKQTYTYHLDQKKSQVVPVGSIVRVPFGPRLVPGVVLKVIQTRPPFPTKEATIPLQLNALTKLQCEFGAALAEIMHGGLGYTLRLCLPPSGKASIIPTSSPLPSQKVSPAALRAYGALKKGNIAALEHELPQRYALLAQTCYQAVKKGQQVVIIVPEVSLVDPLLQYIWQLIPISRAVAYYGGLSIKEQRSVWYGVQQQSLSVVVGTQKALFLPWQSLAFVAVEQEYYGTHKLWDQYPRLHGVYGSELLARSAQAHVFFLTSFPSLKLRASITEKSVQPIVSHPLLVAPTIISSQFTDRKLHNLLPGEFVARLKRYSKAKEKIFILCNKRGAWQIAWCKACRTVARCKKCGTTLMAEHKDKSRVKTYHLLCRKCGYKESFTVTCTVCKKGRRALIRPGIETIEQVLHSLFPRQKILRVDAGTLHPKADKHISKADILSQQIVIGTSAALTLVEGAQFDRVVWLFPEDALAFPDVRSIERAWYLSARLQQLLPKQTHVTLITNYQQSVEDAFKKSSDSIFEQQQKLRQRLQYPPATDMVRLTFFARGEKQAFEQAETSLKRMKKAALDSHANVIIRGPYTSSEKKSGGAAHLLLRGQLAAMLPLYKDSKAAVADYIPERIL